MLVVLKAIMMALEMIKVIMGMLSEIIVVVMVVEMGGSDISIDYGEGKRGKACSTGKCGEDDCGLCVLW